ncbi:hypothetical protein PMI01_04812 [Caulobacter sp. AP07]|uniref:hypothetical protein n=1 Tax=Caulobacter sp. AP07 TaxID=1144304 RepID=UPI000271E942|nr:hypothetical protein [Caulobacter sp. AP07]EJL23501.1 hypothetical protein PMI01_04812 [Caulobacter sp. AP07]
MPKSPTVTIFNANPIGIQVSVNNGPQFAVAGASPPNWNPQTSTSDGPTWSYNRAAQNVLAPGVNRLTITPSGAAQPSVLTVALPGTFQWSSMQLHIFFDSYGNAGWIALDDGRYVIGNLP